MLLPLVRFQVNDHMPEVPAQQQAADPQPRRQNLGQLLELDKQLQEEQQGEGTASLRCAAVKQGVLALASRALSLWS